MQALLQLLLLLMPLPPRSDRMLVPLRGDRRMSSSSGKCAPVGLPAACRRAAGGRGLPSGCQMIAPLWPHSCSFAGCVTAEPWS